MSKPISRLMREGAAKFHQVFGGLIGLRGGYCALGMAAVTKFGKEPQTFEERDEFVKLAEAIDAEAKRKGVFIVNLNDTKHMTPNQIADILEAAGL